jgi:hypothetical protein
MAIFDKIASLFGGGLVDSMLDTVKAYFPPGMTPQQEAELRLELERQVTERISLLEGTATDLRSVPVIGPIMLFMRGAQRPVWGFAVLYADMMWFSGKWGVMTTQQESALWVINLLVLGFVFGERAVANLAPVISDIMSRRKQ